MPPTTPIASAPSGAGALLRATRLARPRGVLALADGSVFWGRALGVPGVAVGEVVFNTALTGYQEILSDPSYHQQIVTLTASHVGNVGVNPADDEAPGPQVAGLLVRDVPRVYSNWRAKESLEKYLVRHDIVALSDIDTRQLTHVLREKGAQNGAILCGANATSEAALAAARGFRGLNGADLAKVVTLPERVAWSEGSPFDPPAAVTPETPPLHVVAYDFGVKRNILRMLVDRGCRVTLVPAETPASKVLALGPDGVFLSNGPGDPEPVTYAQEAIRRLVFAEVAGASALPVFGICLGHQLLCLALGAKTLKMKFGHHGANHPVRELATGCVLISSQNHGFAVDPATLPSTLRVTHVSLFDGSLQGVEHTERPVFSFQGHPEASPGPHEVAGLFERFIADMRARRRAQT